MLDDRLERDVGLLRPARRGHAVVADVDRNDHAVVQLGDRGVQEVHVLVGRGAEQHARRTGADRLLDRLDRAQAAADLHRHRQLGSDAPDVLEVDRRAAAGSVEVDHVEGAGPALDPPARGVERIRVVDGLLVELAAGQADRLAVKDVDGGQEDHARAPATPAHTPTNASSMRSPSREDFSGWNWTPDTEPWLTIVAKRSPYSVVPTTVSGSDGRAA